MKIAVSGPSGLVGSALVPHLTAAGHEVVRLVRRAPGSGEVRWDPANGQLDPADLAGVDAVVNLAGAGIGDHRWTEDYKRELLDSRLSTTGLLARTIASLDERPSVFLSGSAVGWYGDRGDEELDESSPAGTGFLADVCRQWEAAARPAQDAGVRVAHLRSGIVLSAAGGALKKQLPLFKLGLGGRMGSGRQWWSWISIDDEVGAITHLLDTDVEGPVNLTAPNPVTNAELTKELAHAVNRPSLLPIPAFGAKLLLGSELADALLFSGQRVVPTVLISSRYRFRHETLPVTLRDIVSGSTRATG